MLHINTNKKLTGFFIYIIGFSGSGKLSTAIELSNAIDGLIVSSDLSSNVRTCSIYDEAFEHSKETQDRLYNIVQVMLQVIEAYPIDSKNYIFTNELIKNNDYSTGIYNSIVRLGEKMNAKLLPVILKCNLPTLQKRIELKMQKENRKIKNVVEKFRNKDLFIPPGAIEIENSNMGVKDVAEKIVSHMHKLRYPFRGMA
ncbi:hypothetical protein [Wolbachia endosymbiont of Ctenocephalides felis wCfeT]|uniref:hypothetical protein n=1 Tax=Wolbachia endosymbiont of Ctenocephalides felis wCfeT TaxID=2732593 RepID=UPI0014458156|nr:hypothetical protein [Wolbachia endosymbiont of Ctenocephalides felis wCfeT]